MGPIGMLIIQRTLNRGRRPGFFTGIGAASSDLIYCLLTGLGLAFVTDFVESQQALLQVGGSIFIMAYAVWLYRSKPAPLNRPLVNQQVQHHPLRDAVTGFLFTFSNPLILFFIVGLFARFNFLAPEFQAYHYVAGYGAIFAGALGWWWGVTRAVDRMRSHFNVRSLRLVNRVIASILGLMGLFGLITGLYTFFNPSQPPLS